MNTQQKNQAVVRDPGTAFICWDTTHPPLRDNKCLLIVRNLSSGKEERITIDYNSGKYYLHSLIADSYYTIILAQPEKNSDKLRQILDFGVIHTFKNSISELTDPDPRWQTDRETLLRLTGTEYEGTNSSNAQYR